MKDAVLDRVFQEVISGTFFDFTSNIGETIQFYEYASTVLKPPIGREVFSRQGLRGYRHHLKVCA